MTYIRTNAYYESTPYNLTPSYYSFSYPSLSLEVT